MRSEALREYHERTKHTPESVRSGGSLDWSNVPVPVKRYPGMEAMRLPALRPTGVPCHVAIARSATCDGDRAPTAATLSNLLFHAAGVIRTMEGFNGPVHFRTYASAGALYPNEVYLVCGDLDGLEAGVYHYAPAEHALTTIRTGDLRGALGLDGEAPGAATLILSAIPWRTAWKYGARGFRHLYWDAGMMLANLLAAAAAHEVRARVAHAFVDAAMNDVLALDGNTEVAICAVPLGRGETATIPDVEPLDLRTSPVSPRPKRDPLIEEAHHALVLRSAEEVAAARAGSSSLAEVNGDPVPVEPLPPDALSPDLVEDVVRRRGSSRKLARTSFPAAECAAILDRALAGIPADWNAPTAQPFLVANALDGIPGGTHAYAPGGTFHALQEGEFRREAGFLCLEQPLGADAAAVLFLMSDLDRSLRSVGSRAYAAAQLEAAIVAGRVYLGAYAQCLGASGITFYDDEVSRFFDTQLEPMLSVVIGPEAGRRSVMRCRERRAR